MESNKKRLLFLIDVLGIGGAERLLALILKHLSTERYETRVCVFREIYGNPIADRIRELGIPVDLLPLKRLRDPSAIPRLLKYCREHQIDLVHAQLDTASTLGCMASRILGIPSVSTVHTLEPKAEKFRARGRQKLLWFSQRNFCDRVIAVSEMARQHFIEVSGVSSEKVVTIYNGIELDNFAPTEGLDRFKLRQELGIPPQAPLLITIAMLRQLKGIQFMFQALPQILEQFPDLYYLVVGEGRYHDALVSLVDEMGLAERVRFTGLRQDVPDLLAEADLFVLPTLTEALPTVLAEAMAARIPIVVCEVGGVPEMVTNGKNGLLVPPADPDSLAQACISLLSDEGLQHNLTVNGWQMVNQSFSIERQVKNLEQLYDELLTVYGK